ncbi:MAG: YceH family protein [Candidatus Eisenbacteria bacterium]|nr:YceH family protein [Candidatus Eisenbacteria bacterium]
MDEREEKLSERELRVVGCLIEKERTTPEYYPLTVNALVNACNQKSNRDPVVAYGRDAVREALDALRWSGWVTEVDEAGSRATKYKHRFIEKTGLDAARTAILAELMLRGPQTAGEVHGRAKRMFPFTGLEEVRLALEEMAAGEEPRVVLLPRQPGRKERRYRHLLSGPPSPEELESAEEAPRAAAAPPAPGRASEELESLRGRVEALEKAFDEFRRQFE